MIFFGQVPGSVGLRLFIHAKKFSPATATAHKEFNTALESPCPAT